MAEVTQISLRLSPDMYKRLKNRTEKSGLSLNAEVIQALEKHLRDDELQQRVNELEKQITLLKTQLADLPRD